MGSTNIMARFLPLIFIVVCGLVFSCNISDAEDGSEYEYEMNLTESQLQKELELAKDISDESYCFRTCRTLIVPSNKTDSSKWSSVSLCRINICHSTDLCTKNVIDLKKQVSSCNGGYIPDYEPPVSDEPETEAISSSSEAIVEESSSGFSETGTEDLSSSSETVEESSSSSEIGQ